MAEHRLADVRHHALAEPGDEEEAAVGRDGQHDDDAEQREQRLVQEAGVALGEAAVDQPAQTRAHHQHGAGGDGERHQRADDLQAVGRDEAQDMAQLADILGGRGLGSFSRTGRHRNGHFPVRRQRIRAPRPQG